MQVAIDDENPLAKNASRHEGQHGAYRALPLAPAGARHEVYLALSVLPVPAEGLKNPPRLGHVRGVDIETLEEGAAQGSSQARGNPTAADRTWRARGGSSGVRSWRDRPRSLR